MERPGRFRIVDELGSGGLGVVHRPSWLTACVSISELTPSW
jgi:hypothetical protein